MKNIFKICFVVITSFSLSAQAITVEVLGEKGEQLFKQNIGLMLPSNVGETTIAIFDQHSVPHKGTDSGIVEIYNLKQEIKVVSDTEMKAYGWCFSINGIVVETMPDETNVITADSIIQSFNGSMPMLITRTGSGLVNALRQMGYKFS